MNVVNFPIKRNTTVTLIKEIFIDILNGATRNDILKNINLLFCLRIEPQQSSMFLFDKDGNYLKSAVNYVNGEFIELDIIFPP